MKRIISILMVALLVLAMPAAAFAANYEDAKNSVVRIYVEVYVGYCDYNGNNITDLEPLGFMTGTGFAVGEAGKDVRYFVTNNHVVGEETYYEPIQFQYNDGTIIDAYEYYVYQPYLIFGEGDVKVSADVYARSARCDLAVLAIAEPTDKREAAILRPFETGTLSNETVYALGFPYVTDLNDNSGLVQYDGYVSEITVTDGLIQNVREHEETKEGQTIQHGAKITNGNSGGPLVDKSGKVIGVNYAVWTADTDYGLAISTNELIRMLDAEKIPYATKGGLGTTGIIIIAAAVVVLGAAVALVLVLTLRNKGNAVRMLVGMEGALAGQNFSVKKGQKVSIGRDGRRCQIVLPNDCGGVSSLHCSITFDGRAFYVTDENSSYGTWIDQNKLVPNTPTIMHRGQVMYLGSKKQSIKLHS